MNKLTGLPLSYVYDGKKCVGHVLARGRAGYEGFNRNQQSLGLFRTAPEAANAVFDAAANEERAG
jgi:hypothetical protein